MGRKLETAVAALLTEPSIAAAAAATGINERTLRGWMGDAKFVKVYKAARDKALRHAIGRLQHVMVKAIARLEKVIDGQDDKLAVSAAGQLLANGFKATEADLVDRVAALEELSAGRKTP